MLKRLLPERAFWSSKVGLAACASIAAMVIMVLATTTVEWGETQAAPLTFPLADSAAMAGLA